MTNDEYVEYVWRRISRGRPQNEIGVYRNAIQSTMPAALQKLATYVCADDALSTILQRTYGLVLMGPVTIENYLSVAVGALSPTLLLSKDSQDKWIVMIPTLSDFPLQRLPNFTSLRNPPPTPDFYFYTLYKSRIYVVDSTGESPPAISGYDMSLT
jgi:hypothetical protein